MTKSLTLIRAGAFALTVASCVASAAAAPFSTVYSFDSVAGPVGNLTLDGSKLYGVTPQSGANNQGTVWSVNVGGTGFQTLHSFSNPPNASPDPKMGLSPKGGLLVSGDGLIGAAGGGPQEGGIWYSIGKDGSNFSIINQFTTSSVGSSFGWSPNGDLTGGDFGAVGTTRFNGANSRGVMVGVGIPNTPLPGGSGGLSGPQAGLVPDGAGYFYGTTAGGGLSGRGGVFRVGTNGFGYQVMHLFTGGVDGQSPNDILEIDGNKVYGTTNSTIFSMNLDGSGYQVLSTSAGDSPLLYLAGKLYGASGNRVFALNLANNTLETLYQGTPGDGFSPSSGLVLVGSKLYGASEGGGANNKGMIYAVSINVPEPSAIVLAACGLVGWAGVALRKRLVPFSARRR